MPDSVYQRSVIAVKQDSNGNFEDAGIDTQRLNIGNFEAIFDACSLQPRYSADLCKIHFGQSPRLAPLTKPFANQGKRKVASANNNARFGGYFDAGHYALPVRKYPHNSTPVRNDSPPRWDFANLRYRIGQ